MIMVERYIKIKYLCARVPFSECFIQFVIKKKGQEPVLYPQMQFYAKCISYEVDDNIQLVCSEKHITNLAIYLMAINKDNRVSCIGYVPLNLSQPCINRKEKLLGLSQQSGYIVYSLQLEPFLEMKNLIKTNLSSSSKNSDDAKLNASGKDKHVQKQILQIENENKKLNRSKRKQGYPHQLKEVNSLKQVFSTKRNIEIVQKNPPTVEQSKDRRVVDQHEELQAFYIELLKHKVKNGKYFQTLRRNKQFLQKSKKVCRG